MDHASNRYRVAVAAAGLCLITATAARAQVGGTTATRIATTKTSTPLDGDKRPQTEGPLVNAEYRLGPGDKLRIEVYKDPQLSQSVQIRPDGKITMPLIGDIDASGRTPLDLRDTIARSLKEYVNNPVVTVIVVEALASQIFVMGEVANAGPQQLHGPTTVLQALAMAGGFKEFANTKDVRVLRQTATGMQTIKFNYRDAVNGDAKPVYLRSGDTIIVR